jgi:hypothetical protein
MDDKGTHKAFFIGELLKKISNRPIQDLSIVYYSK